MIEIFTIRKTDREWALIGVHELGVEPHDFTDIHFNSKLMLLFVLRHVGRYESWDDSSPKELPELLRNLHRRVG